MKANITGIGPMMACMKGRESLDCFDLERLWQESDAPWFDPKTDLGGRGFKYFNNATRYMIAAVREFDDPNADDLEQAADNKGVVIGSNSCTRRELDEFDETLLTHGASAINPMRAPSFCANVGTGNISIKHRAKAFNITLMNPLTAGLEAVVLAKNAIAEGRADTVIAGAMEDDGEYALAQGGAVRTRGGAWAFRLQADDVEQTSVAAQLGASLNHFMPSLPDRSDDGFVLSDRVGLDFAPLLAQRNGEIPVYVAMLTDRHSRFVLSMLQGILGEYGIHKDAIVAPSRDSQHGTLLSLAYLSWCALNHDQAVCVAISPLGHISAVTVEKPNRNGH